MLKSKIRKKILNLRKSKNIHNIKLDFLKIYNILKIYNLKNKSIGGYYPINYELSDLNILKGLELKKIKIFIHNSLLKFCISSYFLLTSRSKFLV